MVLSPIGTQFTEYDRRDNRKSASGTGAEIKWTIGRIRDDLLRQRYDFSINQGLFKELRNDLMVPR